ncbi:MAG: hypothetical protein IT256_06895 [Chitinophagaceae bacterium]|nr:hypothetical protein [Chitinophagaceae bacterium]
MNKTKKVGIWMDHKEAHLFEFDQEATAMHSIANGFSYEDKQETLSRSEDIMQNKNQQHLAAYYKEIESAILPFDEVLIFGPTDAKTELSNIIDANLKFKDTKITVQAADKMNDNQKIAFIKDYFTKA